MNWKTKKPVFKPGRIGAVVHTKEVWVVSAGYDYYPGHNNTQMITTCQDRAWDYQQRLLKEGDFDWVDLDREILEIV